MVAIAYLRFLMSAGLGSSTGPFSIATLRTRRDIKWVVSGLPPGFILPEWLLTVGLGKSGEIYLAAGLGLLEHPDDLLLVEQYEATVARAAQKNNQDVIMHGGHFYLPIDWLLTYNPVMCLEFEKAKALAELERQEPKDGDNASAVLS